jgi:hypothetical protein
LGGLAYPVEGERSLSQSNEEPRQVKGLRLRVEGVRGWSNETNRRWEAPEEERRNQAVFASLAPKLGSGPKV